MNKFSQFGIEPPVSNPFIGDKIKMTWILNSEITVTDYSINNSKFGEDDKCLCIQLKFAEKDHIVFTGSKSLLEAIKSVGRDNLPFTTTIIKIGKRFQFS